MKIIPTLTVMDGKAVHMKLGDFSDVTVLPMSPLETAQELEDKGAKFLHIIDLNGAKDGVPANFDIITEVMKKTHLNCEVGGGIRNQDIIDRYLSSGANRIIMSTVAAKHNPFLRDMISIYNDRIMVGVDVKDGRVAVDGWVNLSGLVGEDFCKKLSLSGVRTLIFTDIGRHGTMDGVDIELFKRLQKNSGINIIASGGVATMEDIKKLNELNLFGAIIDSAFTNDIDIKEAILCTGNDLGDDNYQSH